MKNNVDEELCLLKGGEYIKRYGHDTPIDQYPVLEGIVVMVITSLGIIENGGFHYFFESQFPGDPYYNKILEAYQRIGADKAYEILKKVLNLFPNAIPPENDQERLKIYESVPEVTIDQLETEFYQESDNIITALASFIRIHLP